MAERFDAFISYSHAADGLLAPRVTDGLQRFAKPWFRRRALRVFRDAEGLSANPGLWTSITVAMDASDFFVLLASPEAAESVWVNREIVYWCETKEPGRILTVLTDGEFVWSDTAGGFDWEASTSVPTALAAAFSEEPRHVDMRWARAETQLDLRDGRFRDQIAELAAPMHGVDKDDLTGEDVRQHRRTLRMAWSAALALLVLLCASVVGAFVAVRQADAAKLSERRAVAARDDATRQRQAAQQNATEARRQKDSANSNAHLAALSTTEAQRQKAQAIASSRAANQSAADARHQKDVAAQSAIDAQNQRNQAVASSADAQRQKLQADAAAAAAQLSKALADSAAAQARISKAQADIHAANATASAKDAQAQRLQAEIEKQAALTAKAEADHNAAVAMTQEQLVKAANAQLEAANKLLKQRADEIAKQQADLEARNAELQQALANLTTSNHHLDDSNAALLAAQAKTYARAGHYDIALLLAVEANKIAASHPYPAKEAMFSIMQGAGHLRGYAPGTALSRPISAPGHLGWDNVVWDLNRAHTPVAVCGSKCSIIGFDATGTRVVVKDNTDPNRNTVVSVHDTTSGASVWALEVPPGGYLGVENFNRQHTKFLFSYVFFGGPDRVGVVDLISGHAVMWNGDLASSLLPGRDHLGAAQDGLLDFSPDGHHFLGWVVDANHSDFVIWDTDAPTQTITLYTYAPPTSGPPVVPRFAPDGAHVIGSPLPGVVTEYDAHTGGAGREITVPPFAALAVDHKDNQVATFSSTGDLRVTSLASGKVISVGTAACPPDALKGTVDFSPGDSWVAIACIGSTMVQTATGAVTYVPSGFSLFGTGFTGTTVQAVVAERFAIELNADSPNPVYDLQTGRAIQVGLQPGCDLTPSQQLLACGDQTLDLTTLDPGNLAPVPHLVADLPDEGTAIDPEGKIIYVLASGRINAIDPAASYVPTPQSLTPPVGPNRGWVTDGASHFIDVVAPGRALIADTSGAVQTITWPAVAGDDLSGTFAVGETAQGDIVLDIRNPVDPNRSRVLLVNLHTGLTREGPAGYITSVVSSDGLAIGFFDETAPGPMLIAHTADLKVFATVSADSLSPYINGHRALAPGGAALAVNDTSTNNVAVLDTSSSKNVWTKPSTGIVTDLAFSHGGSQLAIATVDPSNTATVELRSPLDGTTSAHVTVAESAYCSEGPMTWSPDDSLLFAANQLLDGSALSPYGRTLCPPSTSTPASVDGVFSADSTVFDFFDWPTPGLILRAELTPAQLGPAACDIASRNLTQQEWTAIEPAAPYDQSCSQWPVG